MAPCKGEGDARECNNYRSIKFLTHAMKIVELFIDGEIREMVAIASSQCSFIGRKLRTNAIQALRILEEKFRKAFRNLLRSLLISRKPLIVVLFGS